LKIILETTVKVERNKFKRPILILPPEIPDGVYELLVLRGERTIIILRGKDL